MAHCSLLTVHCLLAALTELCLLSANLNYFPQAVAFQKLTEPKMQKLYSMHTEKRALDYIEQAEYSGQWTVGSGQWAVDSGQWTVGNEQ
jgi:hypothetical protein